MESLYKLYANGLYNYGSKFTADKGLIKECIQELFVTLWTRRTNVGEPQSVRNYLFKAFRFSLFKKTKTLQKQERYEETEHYTFDAAINIEEAIISGEDKAVLQSKLQASLDHLTARQREAIFLKFYGGLSYEEIAEIMGISVKGAYKVMARAIDTLREKLDRDDFLLLLTLFSLKVFH
jgi:RNA polymerase sigma factor (sigma-70 family)